MDNDNAEVGKRLAEINDKIFASDDDADDVDYLLAHIEALAERVRLVEGLLCEIVEYGSPFRDGAYCYYCETYENHDASCVWQQALELKQALEQPPLDPMKEG